MSKRPPSYAPAPTSSTEDAVAASTGTSGSASIKSGIKRASTACQSCKQIKRKCDQNQPCSNCVKAGQECVYDQGQDGRRRAARKRNVEELEHKRDALDTILDALRDSNEEIVQTLLKLIRSHAPLEEIINFASTCTGEIAEDQLTSFAVALDAVQPRRSVLSISALVDIPPIKVPARPWTSVTEDDDFVSHLVSTYFTWIHPIHPILVQDLFVKDMVSGDLESQFCSPILLNSICAMACQLSDHLETLTIPGDHTSRGKGFLEEAMSLWTEEAARPCLTTLQAGQPLALALITIGKDRISTSYIDQMNDFSSDLLYLAQRSDLATENPDGYKSLTLAMWSLYEISVDHAIAFMRSRTYRRPQIEQLTADDRGFESGEKWFPYPESQPELATRTGEFAVYQYEVHDIGADIASFLFGMEGTTHVGSDGLIGLENRLKSMIARIPQAEASIKLDPNLMSVNLNCQWLTMTLFNFFRGEGSPTVGPWEDGSFGVYARDQCIQATKNTASLCRLFIRQYGVRTFTLTMSQTAVSAAYMLVEDLEDTEAQQLFHEMCVIVTAAARKSFLMRGHARMLFITADQKHQIIPDRTRLLLEPIALNTWRPDSHKFFETSKFPNYALARGEDPRSATMGDLLSKWKNFRLDSPTSDTTPGIELQRARKRFARETSRSDQEYEVTNESSKVAKR